MSVVDDLTGAPQRVAQRPLPTSMVRRLWKVARTDGWRRARVGYRSVAAGTDALVAFSLAFVFAHTYAVGSPLVAGLGAMLVLCAAVTVFGGYDVRRAGYGIHEYGAILRAGAVLAFATMTVAFFGIAAVPAGGAVVALVAAVSGALVLRAMLRSVLGAFRSRGDLLARALVVGAPESVAAAAEALRPKRAGFSIVGACVPGRDSGTVAGVSVWGDADAAASVALAGDVDVVVVSPRAFAVDEFRRFRWAMEQNRVEVVITTDLFETLPERLDLRVVSATPMLSLRVRQTQAQAMVKAALDRTAALAFLILSSPVLLGAMLAIKVSSPGGAIFRQERVGRRGRPFTMIKLRTMSADAEQRRDDLENSDGAGPLFKVRTDPRVTPIGRLLRRFSIDELPQLWNVARGDMSLVGPRPPLPSEVAVYDVMTVHRLNVRPGMTGLWQVSGRSDLSWEQAVRLDLRYVDNWSLVLDAKIIWRTFRAVLGAHGAY